jgi:hypothetical protein
MKRLGTAGMIFSVIAAALLLGGCGGSYQARNVDIKQSLLVSPSILTPGTGDQALYRYIAPNVNVKNYTKVMIDPVIIGKSGELDAGELEDYQKLANNGYVYLVQELQKDYTVVQSPQAGTFRVQLAIIDADTSKPVRNLTSSVTPIGIGLNIVKTGATGKEMGVGEITAEMKITDAMTGQLLAAALDRRVGGKAAQGILDTWYNADQALQYWAKRLSYVLCTSRGGAGCGQP